MPSSSSSSPISILQDNVKGARELLGRLPLNLTSRTASNAFLLGYVINVALDGIVPALMRKKGAKEFLSQLVSKASLSAGASMALFSLLYRLLLERLSSVRRVMLERLPDTSLEEAYTHRARLRARAIRLLRSAFLVPFLAASFASPALYLFPKKSLVQTYALDTLLKGAKASYNEARKADSRLVSWVPDWVDGGFFYALGNGQLLWSFLFEPSCFPNGYGNLIMARSTAYVPQRPEMLPPSISWPSPREIVDTIADLSTPTRTAAPFPGFVSPLLSSLTPSNHPSTEFGAINPIIDYSPAHPAHERLLCAVLHPGEPSCSRNFVGFFLKEWAASARFVALFTGIISAFSYKKFLKDPESAFLKYILTVIQGATVISGSIGTAWGLICFFQKYLPRTFMPRSRYFLNGFLSSVFILAVAPARRSQLGTYITRMSVTSSWEILKKNGKVKPVRFGEYIMLALGLGLVSAIYEQRPESLERGMKAILNLLLGASAAKSQGNKAFLANKAIVNDDDASSSMKKTKGKEKMQ
ncbi:hypothetical protein IE53DRAFT_201485 [Violaceomyces palustris]|uniref:Uncharacterized protein n=1 Tax=Violaceomyces palustris TaxID=1673888 RepID=A0ACD0P599_9BASI|nr:hypothetical protein IE53DRAFT_201485 [Violaceomyces palustris]